MKNTIKFYYLLLLCINQNETLKIQISPENLGISVLLIDITIHILSYMNVIDILELNRFKMNIDNSKDINFFLQNMFIVLTVYTVYLNL